MASCLDGSQELNKVPRKTIYRGFCSCRCYRGWLNSCRLLKTGHCENLSVLEEPDEQETPSTRNIISQPVYINGLTEYRGISMSFSGYPDDATWVKGSRKIWWRKAGNLLKPVKVLLELIL